MYVYEFVNKNVYFCLRQLPLYTENEYGSVLSESIDTSQNLVEPILALPLR